MLINSISYDELGVQLATFVFTGTEASNGTAYPSYSLGSSDVIIGISSIADDEYWDQYSYAVGGEVESLYAVSEILIVPAPEPPTTVWTLLSGAVLIIVLRRRHRTRPALRLKR